MSSSIQSNRLPVAEIAVPSVPFLRPVEILLADESTLDREGLAVLLNSTSGFRIVAQVESGEAALTEIASRKPALALVDLGLQNLGALEVIRRVRDAGLQTRCGVLTARSDPRTALEVMRHGACGYIHKTSSKHQLLEALTHLSQGGIYISPQIDMPSLFRKSGKQKHLEDPFAGLSSREFQVFSLLVEGVRPKEIAARLSLSPKTIDTYRASLMRKLGIPHLAGLVRFAAHRPGNAA